MALHLAVLQLCVQDRDIVYSCNSTISFNVQWSLQIGVNETNSLTTLNHNVGINKTFQGSVIVHVQVLSRTFGPNSILSTITLENANFSQNKITVSCLALGVVTSPMTADSAVVLVSGQTMKHEVYTRQLLIIYHLQI